MAVNLIIPAAGEATRLRPLTSNTSKVMVRVNGKPTIDYILEQAYKLSDINEIVVVDGALDDTRRYCAKKHPRVKFVRQEELNGPRFAIELGMNELEEKTLPLVVWLGDAIILDDNLELGSDFLLCKRVDDHSNWCMWDGKEFYDKPNHTIENGVALVGLYSFSDGYQADIAMSWCEGPEISEFLDHYGEFQCVMTNQWYDIGQLNTYHRTSAALLNRKARAFNRLTYDHELGTVTKTPNYHDASSMQTLKSEISWYSSLTPTQECFVPRVFDNDNRYELCMSFESGTLLSDLMLYENLTESTWEYIIDKVFRIKLNHFGTTCRDTSFIENFADEAELMWYHKTVERMSQCDNFFTSTHQNVFTARAKRVVQESRPIDVVHGDLHFGNILYNYNTEQIKLIDPSGAYGSMRQTTHGDDIYDWAKLAHDLYHGYNAMVADVEHNQIVKDVFVSKLREYDLPVQTILDGGVILLASCIPLHSDDEKRQKRFADYAKEYINHAW